MSDQLQRVVDWLDDVLTWLSEPLTAMPVERVMARLRGTFDVNVVSWSVQQGPLTKSMIFDPPDSFVTDEATVAEFMAGMHRECHPLTVWYDRTTSVDPQTASRVPSGLVPPGLRSVMVEPLARLGLEQQMTLYQRREGIHGRFFVVARDHRDFDDDDLVVARYVQRSLVTLDRQTRILGGSDDGADPQRRADLGLTGRQLAVLQLVSDGLSAQQAAHRLACSPRTVEKHLQRAYRKLQVNDRVNAIRVARLAGLVVEQPAQGVHRHSTRLRLLHTMRPTAERATSPERPEAQPTRRAAPAEGTS